MCGGKGESKADRIRAKIEAKKDQSVVPDGPDDKHEIGSLTVEGHKLPDPAPPRE